MTTIVSEHWRCWQCARWRAPSTYLLNSIHGLSLDEEIVKRNMKALKGLCGRDMAPEKIARYAVYPARFLELERRNPSWSPALHALWDVYYVRLDLQRGRPISDPATPDQLLQFAADNARAGSQFENAYLAPYAQDYLAIAAGL